ncbi:MAG: hypothetical protein J0I09_05055 [Sphingobacteriia bacterium]|nr:hypothetical protein [Sphingobacteriia bacterium]
MIFFRRFLCFFLSAFFLIKADAQNTLDNLGLSSSTPSAVAFGLRKLSSNYSGPLIRINISPAYYDVYPDNNGYLTLNSAISASYSTYNASATGSTANALSSIISASTTATVCIWYDQSGNNRNAAQPTTANQPTIIQSGNFILKNNQPTISFNGSNNYFQLNYIPTSITSFSINTVASISPSANGNLPIWCSRPTQNGNPPSYQNSITLCLGSNNLFADDSKSTLIGVSTTKSYNDDNLFISSNVWTSSSGNAISSSQFSMYINGNTPTTSNTSIGSDNSPLESHNTQPVSIGRSVAWGSYFYGNTSELIAFSSSLSANNRKAIESNQANYYSLNITSNIWNGNTSTDWNTASNWGLGTVPSSSDNVIIPNTTNQPTIGTGVSAVANTITIQNGSILTLSGTGTLQAASDITVNSGGALLGNSSNVTGTVTVQKTVVGQRGYRVFSNPFSTTQSNLSSSGINTTLTTSNDVKTWDQGSNAWLSAGSGYSNVSIAPNQPYACFIRGASSDLISGLSYSAGPSAFTYNVSGTLNGSSVSVTPANTSNYLIVGNPYAAPLNTQALTGGSSSPYYTYQITQGGSQSTQRAKAGAWVASGSNSNTSNTIPVLGVIAYLPGSTNSFNITTSDINTGGTVQTSLSGIETIMTQMELQLNHANGDYADKLFVRLDANATVNGTDKTDLKKLYNDVTNMYTIAPDKTNMAIDARNALSTIPMGVSAAAGDYAFILKSNNLPEGITVFIHDKYTSTKTELTINQGYNFSVTSDINSQGEGRFELLFSSKNKATATDNTATGKLQLSVLGNITNSNQVAINISGAEGAASVNIINMNGQRLGTVSAMNGIQYINIGQSESGMLLLQVIDSKGNRAISKIVKQ